MTEHLESRKGRDRHTERLVKAKSGRHADPKAREATGSSQGDDSGQLREAEARLGENRVDHLD